MRNDGSLDETGPDSRACGAAQGELDELEREEFFRLKKVQANKRKVTDELALRVRSASWHRANSQAMRVRLVRQILNQVVATLIERS